MPDKTKKLIAWKNIAGSPDGGDAFLPDVARSHGRLADDAAEAFAEEFIASATSAEFVAEDARDEWVTEELGGPFLEVRIGEDEELIIAALDEEALVGLLH